MQLRALEKVPRPRVKVGSGGYCDQGLGGLKASREWAPEAWQGFETRGGFCSIAAQGAIEGTQTNSLGGCGWVTARGQEAAIDA